MTQAKNSHPKVLIMVGHALYEPWSSILYEGQLKTWASTLNSPVVHTFAIPVWHFVKKFDSLIWNLKWHHGLGKLVTGIEAILKSPFSVARGKLIDQELPRAHERAFKINMPDLDLLMNFKSFALITGSLDYEYDYLVCTTTSSYLNLNNLFEVLNEQPRLGFIGGRILEQGSIKFASGSFRIFSRDVVEGFLENRRKFSTWRPEDQAFGLLAYNSKLRVQYVQLNSLDLPSLDKLSEISDESLSETIHFRLKSGTFERRDDVSIMLDLHRRLSQ
jgi:uncharacterized protein YlaN (UPF0358 family)